MLLAVVAAALTGVAVGALIVWLSARQDAPEPITGRRLTPIAPELQKAALETRGNRPVDEVTRSEITRLLESGRKMEAIRLLHASADMSLLQAKARIEEWSDAVERRLLGQAYADAANLDHPEIDETLSGDLRELLSRRWGRWRALKLLRRRTTMRLLDAMHYLDALLRTPSAARLPVDVPPAVPSPVEPTVVVQPAPSAPPAPVVQPAPVVRPAPVERPPGG